MPAYCEIIYKLDVSKMSEIMVLNPFLNQYQMSQLNRIDMDYYVWNIIVMVSGKLKQIYILPMVCDVFTKKSKLQMVYIIVIW